MEPTREPVKMLISSRVMVKYNVLGQVLLACSHSVLLFVCSSYTAFHKEQDCEIRQSEKLLI